MTPEPAHTSETDTRTDEQLVAAIQSGEDGDAWTALLHRYQDRLYGVCLRMVANPDIAADLTQDAMVKIIQGLSGYDGRAKVSTWIIRVTMNVCLSYLRGQKLRRHASLEAMSEGRARRERSRDPQDAPRSPGVGRGVPQEKEPAGPESVELRERRDLVAAALASLAPEQRAIVILRDVQDLDYEQIAAVLEVAVGTVKSRLFRARLALREAIERMESGPSGGPDEGKGSGGG